MSESLFLSLGWRGEGYIWGGMKLLKGERILVAGLDQTEWRGNKMRWIMD